MKELFLETVKLGKQGEQKATDFLKKNGYKIVKRNFVCSFGEVDIICKKDNVIAFVEVKTRKAGCLLRPSENVTKSKQVKYIQMAKLYLLKEKNAKDYFIRFDVVEVVETQINHIQRAFESDVKCFKRK